MQRHIKWYKKYGIANIICFTLNVVFLYLFFDLMVHALEGVASNIFKVAAFLGLSLSLLPVFLNSND